MILQALVHYYEDLLASGALTAQGWSKENVSWGLELGIDGQIEQVYFLETLEPRGKTTKFVPQNLSVPERVIRTRKIVSNFLCDNSGYILGISEKSDPAWSKLCFDACKALHLQILKDVPGEPAEAVRNFFENWQPEKVADNKNVQSYLKEIITGKNIVFLFEGDFVQDDPNIRSAWQQHLDSNEGENTTICLVTGKRGTLARLHPSVKGVFGAPAMGAQLISFNKEAFCSYGHEKGENAPVSSYAAFAYTQALRYLLSDRKHVQHIGNTTVVCWAAGAETAYQDLASQSLNPAITIAEDTKTVQHVIKKIARGERAEWNGMELNQNTDFFVLGLTPNSTRLSVRFFWQNTFASFAANIDQHYEDLKIIRPANDTNLTPSIYQLLQETVNKSAKRHEPVPQLAGDVLRAVLYGKNVPYPATLLNGVNARIFAEQKITPNRAAIIKAYYTRRETPLCPKEILRMDLNKDSNYPPYLLGRLFCTLELLQLAANPRIKTTIKDRYFNAAVYSPVTVFPVIIKLSQAHLKRLEKGHRIYYSKQITELVGRLHHNFPTRLTLPEQGAFEIGYYHQMQEHFTKKEEA